MKKILLSLSLFTTLLFSQDKTEEYRKAGQEIYNQLKENNTIPQSQNCFNLKRFWISISSPIVQFSKPPFTKDDFEKNMNTIAYLILLGYQQSENMKQVGCPPIHNEEIQLCEKEGQEILKKNTQKITMAECETLQLMLDSYQSTLFTFLQKNKYPENFESNFLTTISKLQNTLKIKCSSLSLYENEIVIQV